ncbi:hypothetical protein ACFFLS_13580 [Flavobacterium procerum]|uniref:Cullin family profile domain-containing protein n=1 Tax=Flavobacterium procerum TaxID=1455569 RepID=A0ABV6BTU4_9FLAO
MRVNIFQNVPLVKPSFFQKLFKQLPIENSVIELNNLLAIYPISEISKKRVAEIEKRYQIILKDEFKLNLEEFYAVYLNHCLEEGNLKDEDFDNLNHLRLILSLNDSTAKELHHKIGEIVYKNFFEKAIANGRLIRREEDFLEKIENDLELPKQTVNRISNDVKMGFIHNYANNIIRDLELTPNKEQELQNIAESFRIDLKFDKETTEKLARLHLYWKLQNLPLPTVSCNIEIQKSELCYFKIDSAQWHELKNYKHKPVDYNSNVKELKRFYLNTQKTNNTVYTKYIDSGSLYLTNKRIIFIGRNKNLNIRFEKILRLTPQSNGIEIDKETIKSVFIKIYNQADEFSLILDRLIKQIK